MKIKVDSVELQLGMYVSELDRPWIESPFVFQGFELRADEEIEQVQSICKYVYVDMEQSTAEACIKLKQLHANNSNDHIIKNVPQMDAGHFDEMDFEKSDFKEELIIARKARDKTRSYIDSVLEDVRMGNSINTRTAKEMVTRIAESVTRNPDASVWLTNLKNRDEYTAIHCVNVCVLTIIFSRALGLPEEQLIDIGMAGLLHDIGKIKVPLEILNKPGRLTDEDSTTTG